MSTRALADLVDGLDRLEVAHLLRGGIDPAEFHARLRRDPRFMAEVAFCHEAAIPRLVFLGRVVAPGEPEWTEYDRNVAVAFQSWRSALCPGCGQHPLDWTPVDGHDPFVVAYSTCESCKLLGEATEQIPEKERRHTRAHLVGWVPPENPDETIDDVEDWLADLAEEFIAGR